MKKIVLILGCSFAIGINAQWTDNGTDITTTDRVGIGTTSPLAKLQVQSSGTIGGYWNPSNSYFTLFDGGGQYLIMDSNELYGSNTLHIGARDGQNVVVFRSVLDSGTALDRMMIKNNGFVGIGTTNPSEKLHISNGLIKIDGANTDDNNSPGIVLNSNDDFLYDGQYINHYGFGFHGYQDGSTSNVDPPNSYMSGYFGIDLFTSGQNRLRISRDGIVSIGTTERQSGYKLAVNGKIKAKEIKVETGWADYVFKEDYDLPTLQEVEKHIKEKGHLINIPSAEEVEENGIQLGEMNMKLLEKIEELTLYTLAQEEKLKLMNQLNEEIREQERRIEKLEQLLNK